MHCPQGESVKIIGQPDAGTGQHPRLERETDAGQRHQEGEQVQENLHRPGHRYNERFGLRKRIPDPAQRLERDSPHNDADERHEQDSRSKRDMNAKRDDFLLRIGLLGQRKDAQQERGKNQQGRDPMQGNKQGGIAAHERGFLAAMPTLRG